MSDGSETGGERDGKRKVRGPGYLVIWDADGGESPRMDRVRHFLLGGDASGHDDGAPARGFADKDGVRCVAPTVFFVKPNRLAEIRRFLRENGIDHEVDPVVFT